jgi:hypothetical protein
MTAVSVLLDGVGALVLQERVTRAAAVLRRILVMVGMMICPNVGK